MTLWRTLRTWTFLWLMCAGMAAATDVLFYRHVVGWSAALFVVAALVAIAVRMPAVLRRPAARMLLVLGVGIAVALAREPSFTAVVMAVLIVAALAMVGRGTWTWRLGAWGWRWMYLLVKGPVQSALDVFTAGRWLWRHPDAADRRGSRMALGGALWMIPLAIGVLFLVLFAIANPIIEGWLRDAWRWLSTTLAWLPDFLQPTRVLLWIFTAVVAYAVLRYRQRGRARGGPVTEAPPRVAAPLLSVGLIVRALIVCNAVFLAQTSLDVIYLWGGAKLPAGMTFAAYAHRGAYVLVATALLAAGMVLVCFRRGGAGERSPLARRLVFLWIAQNLFLLVSTVWRLWLYVDAYSLTRWRLSAMVWVALVAVGFLGIIWKIVGHRSNAWLLRMNIATLLCVLYAVAFCNIPGWIAAFNVRHCREIDGRGAPLDVAYLRSLGVPALPAVAWVKDRVAVAAVETDLRRQLGHELSDWRGWTWERQEIAAAIPPLPPLPEPQEIPAPRNLRTAAR